MGWSDIVRMRREALEMTQEQLAKAASVSLKTVGNLENGTATPQRGTLGKIRSALGLSSDPLVAAGQAQNGTKSERTVRQLGLRPAAPAPPTGLDRYLRNLEARLADLEERVEQLEASEASATTDLTQDDVALAASDMDDFADRYEEPDTP